MGINNKVEANAMKNVGNEQNGDIYKTKSKTKTEAEKIITNNGLSEETLLKLVELILSNQNTDYEKTKKEISEELKEELKTYVKMELIQNSVKSNPFLIEEFEKELKKDKGDLKILKTLFSQEIDQSYWINFYHNSLQYLLATGATQTNLTSTKQKPNRLIIKISNEQHKKLFLEKIESNDKYVEEIISFLKLIESKENLIEIVINILEIVKNEEFSTNHSSDIYKPNVYDYFMKKYRDIIKHLIEKEILRKSWSYDGYSTYLSCYLETKELLILIKSLKEINSI